MTMMKYRNMLHDAIDNLSFDIYEQVYQFIAKKHGIDEFCESLYEKFGDELSSEHFENAVEGIANYLQDNPEE